MKKPSPLIGIFITVFLDLVGFGIFIPDIQVRSESLGARGPMIGLVIASFSIAQFVTAPILGRWSDKYGRRTILIVTSLLALVSYLVYSQATSLPVLFAARILCGIAGANLGVAYAYIADVTSPEDRAKGMGLVGAAFGLGFILGPGLGAILLKIGGHKPFLLGIVGAVFAALNLLYLVFFVPEPVRTTDTEGSAFTIAKLKQAFVTPGLGLLLVLFFAYSFSFSNLESTFFRLAINQFRMKQEEGAIVLIVVGVVAALMQGWLIRILNPRLGEVRMLRIGFLMVAPMLALMPFAPPWTLMLCGAVVLGVGNGMAQPSLSSLVSRSAPATMQGGIFGVTQGLGAFARMFGPMLGNGLYDLHYAYPYFAAGILMLGPIAMSWFVRLKVDAIGEQGGTLT